MYCVVRATNSGAYSLKVGRSAQNRDLGFLGPRHQERLRTSASSQLVTVIFFSFLTLSHVIMYVLYRASEKVSRVSCMAKPVAGRFQRPARADQCPRFVDCQANEGRGSARGMGSDTSMVVYLVLFRGLLIPRGGRTRAVVCHASLHLTSRHDRDSQIASSSSKSGGRPTQPLVLSRGRRISPYLSKWSCRSETVEVGRSLVQQSASPSGRWH